MDVRVVNADIRTRLLAVGLDLRTQAVDQPCAFDPHHNDCIFYDRKSS